MEPTQKQINYIKAVEEELGIRFTGKTKQDAYIWLSKYGQIYNELNELYFEHIYDTYNAMDRN